MLNQNIIENSRVTPVVFFILGSLGLISILVMDLNYWYDWNTFIKNGWPDFSMEHLIRSFIILISVLAILWGFIGNKKPSFVFSELNDIPVVKFLIIAQSLLSILFINVFIFNQTSFATLSVEDGPVETGTFFLLFGCCVITATSYMKFHKFITSSKIIRYSLVFLAFVFFIMAMEEISWGQRILQIKTPMAFGGNKQGEINLHNFSSSIFDNLFYFGSFMFLVVFPFVRWLFPFVSNNNYLKIFVPRQFIAILGSIGYAYNFDMWNGIFTQISFFASVLVLFSFAIFSCDISVRNIVLFVLSIVILSQAIFLTHGSFFVRIFEIKEYKELFISIAFVIYSFDLFRTIKRTYSPINR